MILQAVLAFTDYKFADGIFGSEFVGFGNFVRLFTQLPESAWWTTPLSSACSALYAVSFPR